MTFAERFEIYKQNISKSMLQILAEDLGISISSLENLGVGFYPKKQAWVFAERDANGDIIGLMLRFMDGKKFCEKGSKRGLVYEYNTDYIEGDKRYEAGRFHWVRLADAGVTCPICAKTDWCLVSSDDPHNPSAAICSRISNGSIRELSGCGYVHILDAKRQHTGHHSSVLPDNTKLPIIIIEGASDVLAAMELGFVAIGRPSAEGGVELLKGMPLVGKEIWIIGENDAGVGKAGMEKTFLNIKKFSDNIYCIMPPEGIKDLRQWVKHGLTQEDLFAYVGEHGSKGGVFDPNTFDDDVAYGIAKRYINAECTIDGKQILRNYKGQWMKWCNGKYNTYEIQKLRGAIYRFLDGKRYIKETAKGIEIAPYRPTARKISDIIDAFNYISPVYNDPPIWLDSDKECRPTQVIAFKNGLLDIDKYMKGNIVLHKPTPEYFTLATMPYVFNPKMESTLYDNLLTVLFNADEEVIRLLDQWLGYNVVPDNSMEKFMLFTGDRRSGKGTVLTALAETVGRGQYCATSFQSMISQFGCASLLGKLSAILGDAKTPRVSEAGTALELILQIIGNDPVVINQKYRDAFTAQLFCRFTMAMNELPGFSDHSRALESRLNIINFPNSYAGKEDFTLKPRIAKEAREGKLINRALRGLKDLYESGRFIVPETSKEIIQRFTEITNPTIAFVNECCILDRYDSEYENELTKDQLYDAWCGWCDACGRKPGLKQNLCQRVLQSFPNVRKKYMKLNNGDRIYGFGGITLRNWVYKKYLED